MAGPQKLDIEKGLVEDIQALYENSSSAVLLNSQLGEFFMTTVAIRRGCLRSAILFNFVLEKIMQDTIDDHHTSISIGGRSIRNLRFADDIDFKGGSNYQLQDLTNRLIDRATA